jgi:hypothetical protein
MRDVAYHSVEWQAGRLLKRWTVLGPDRHGQRPAPPEPGQIFLGRFRPMSKFDLLGSALQRPDRLHLALKRATKVAAMRCLAGRAGVFHIATSL